jgi:ferrous iron transport protein A
MTEDTRKYTILDLKDGQSGTVADISGGFGLVGKLTSMGIRPGKHITRFCSMFLRGPVTVRVDNVQLALGRGLAAKVQVIPDGAGNENPACR